MSLPTLDELLALRAAAQGLSLEGARTSRALQAGVHHSMHRGRGLEFQEVRPYVEGDDPRSIDWRVTARRGRPHTKLYRQERERPVWIVVDLTAGMFFGSRVQLKSALAVRAAALLAWTAIGRGDRVGAVLAGSADERILPPRAREAGVLPLLGGLLEMQPTAPVAPRSLRTLSSGLDALLPLIHPGSLILVLSDFASLTPGDLFWPALAAHNDCHLFWITDPLEARGLPDGRYRVGWPGRSLLIDGALSRKSWRARWEERRGRIEALAGQIGAPLTELSTQEPAASVLRPLFMRRQSAA